METAVSKCREFLGRNVFLIEKNNYAENFYYKHRILDEGYESGVVLYRNAFSI